MTTPPRPLAELKANECRWPVNEASQGDVHLFCGAAAVAAKPYCADHCRLAYRMKGQAED